MAVDAPPDATRVTDDDSPEDEMDSTQAAEALAADIAKARAAASHAGFEFIDLDMFELDPASGDVIAADRAYQNRAVAVGWRYGLPIVAVAHPEDLFALDDVYLAAGRDVHIVVASGIQIDSWIDRIYARPARAPQPPGLDSYLSGIAPTTPFEFAPSVPPPSARSATPAPPIVQTPPSAPEALDPDLAIPVTDPTDSSSPVDSSASEVATNEVEVAHPDPVIRADAPEEAELPGGGSSLENVLLKSGKVSREDLRVAMRQQVASGRSLRELVAELGLVSEADLQQAVAEVEGLEFVDLNNWTIDQSAADLLPEPIARRYHILAIGFRDDRPIIAMANPSDVFALDDVRSLLGREVETVICAPQQVEEYLRRIYRRADEADDAARNAALSAVGVETNQHSDVLDLQGVVEEAPIVKFVNLIMRQALSERASDVHIEPTADDLQVRFRIDGVLHHVTSVPKAIQGGVVSRLKIMADLDIADHRVPQDGRLSLNASGRQIDLRVATLPTVHGEKVVLRVLDKSNTPLDLTRLGFLPDVLERFSESYRKPAGTIMVTGPTGSGKSTTLYATLNQLNEPERNVITVEDPVEYQLRGVNQVQVNPKAGLTFANALRAILRSDPDVVLVGEIRDRETATIAIEAALTGHLVLSCLHTNNAASTPLRLIEMGVEPFLVCSALDCVLAQRLARQLCKNCIEDYTPTPEDLKAARWSDDLPIETPTFRRAPGCQACSRTGYHGRLAVHEVMNITEEIERAVLDRASTEEIKRIAISEGMRTLHKDGLTKAAMGLTSLEEIMRVIV